MFVEDGREILRVFLKDGIEHTISTDDEGLAYLLNDGYKFVRDLKEIVREPAARRDVNQPEEVQ